MKFRKQLLGLTSLFILAILLFSFNQDNGNKEWKGSWVFEGKSIDYNIKVKSSSTKAPVIFYLTNLKIQRIGTLTDDAIIADLVAKGFLVVSINCNSFSSTSPVLEQELSGFHLKSSELLIEAIKDKELANLLEVYYLPAGYTIARNLSYWNVLDNGAYGTAEHIVKMYNKHAVRKHKVTPVKTIEEIKGRKGEPINYDMHMDIIYPAGKPLQNVPLMVNFSTQSQRMSMFSVAKAPDRITYPLGFLLTGYAWTNVDHNFVPIFRDEYYGFVNGDYSLDKWNGLASSTAAIRFLRKNAKTYNLNDKIGAMGISKASYSVTRLADAEHAKLAEYNTFTNALKGSPKTQPLLGVSSRIDAGYTAAGGGTDRYEYVSTTTVPLAMSVGKLDKFKKWDPFPKLLAKCEENNVNYLPIWMEEIAHTYPIGKDFASGKNRYVLLKQFFDAQLKNNKELEVLYLLPSNGNKEVLLDGFSMNLSPSVAPPPNMEGLSIYSPITVRFAVSVPSSSINGKTVSITNAKTGEVVQGEWKTSLQSTRYDFLPTKPLAAKTDYIIKVLPGVKSSAGTILNKEIINQFTTQ